MMKCLVCYVNTATCLFENSHTKEERNTYKCLPKYILFFFLDQTCMQVFILDNASSVSQAFHCIRSDFDLELVVRDAVYT